MLTGTTHFDFEVTYQSPDGSKFRILPMRLTDVEESAQLVTKIFVTREPIAVALNCSYEEVFPFMRVLTQKSMEHGLGLVAKDEQERIIGLMINLDEYQESKDPISLTECVGKMSDIQDMLHKSYLQNSSDKPFEVVNIVTIAVADGLGSKAPKIGTQLLDFITNSHPSRPKKVWGQATNPATIKLGLNFGYTLQGIFDPKTYANEKGELIFKDIDEKSIQMFGKPYPGIHVYLKDNSGHANSLKEADLRKSKL